MNKNNLLANRDEVVIVGIGNGGLAALAWADKIKASTKGKVRVMVDGGIWEN
jgi:threonine dehydrogenase-like Zn-dependent dehydrogenase